MTITLPLGKKGSCQLVSDSTGYTINTRGKKKDGTPGEYRPAAYCSTPESAFNRILEMNIRASEATSLMELRDDLLNARQELQASWGASFNG